MQEQRLEIRAGGRRQRWLLRAGRARARVLLVDSRVVRNGTAGAVGRPPEDGHRASCRRQSTHGSLAATTAYSDGTRAIARFRSRMYTAPSAMPSGNMKTAGRVAR